MVVCCPSVLSPYGHQLAALTYLHGTGFLTVFDAVRGTVLQQVGTGSATDPVIGDGTVAADGPFYSANGKSLWVSQSADLLRFAVNSDGTVAPKPVVIPLAAHLPLTAASDAYLPSGMVESTNQKTLYVALNGANTVGVIDIATDKLVRQIPVGVAPRQVALVGGRLFVSNEGGRTATAADFTNLTDNTPVVADKVTGAATSGTVSVVDPSGVKPTLTIKVGLQPTALKVSGSTLFVANSNDDSVSIIDTAKATVTQTFNVAPLPGSTEGSNPNAIEMTDGNHLLVSIGRDNALAVYRYKRTHLAGAVPGPDPHRLVSGQRAGRPHHEQDRRHQRQGHRRPRSGRPPSSRDPTRTSSWGTTPTTTPVP